VSKFSYKTLLIIFLSLLISIVVLWKFVLPKQSVKATWWNDSWNYRQAINISSHTSLESNVYIITTVNIGTTAKAQTDDGDFRFIDQSGQNLDYYIASGIGTTNLTFHILIPSFPVGAQTIYVYYGNTTATNGFSSSDFTTQATNYTIGSLSTEEVGGGPIAYWKFDEGVGTIAYDSSSNQNNGNLIGTTLPTWISEDQCINGKCLKFNGTNNYINTGNNPSLNINTNSITVETWVKFDFLDYSNNTGKLIGFAGKGHPDVAPGTSSYGWWFSYDNRNNGKTFKYSCFGNSAGGWNGGNNNFSTSSYTFDQNTWYHLAFTIGQNQGKLFINGKQIGPTVTFTGLQLNNSTSNQYLGSIQGFSNMFGFQDDLKIYPYARTADQIKLDYNSRGSSKGTTANLGIKSNTSPSLSSKLIAYYKFDEGSGNTIFDSTSNENNGNIGSGVSSPSWTNNGKIGKGIQFNDKNIAINMNNPSILNMTTNNFTVSNYYYGFDTGYNTIIEKRGTGLNGFFYVVNYPSSGKVSIFLNDGGSQKVYNFTSANININNWYQLTTTINRQTNEAKLYINGKYIQTVNISATTGSLISDGAFRIGYDLGGSTFNGLIDEVKIYNSALTDDEVKQDYNQGSVIQFGSNTQNIGGTTTSLDYCIPGDNSYCASPVAEWKMDEGIGTSTLDTSGNNNTGTITGATWTQGKIGSGLNFDGITNIVDVPDLAFNGPFTYSFWINSNNNSGTKMWSSGNGSQKFGMNAGSFFTRVISSSDNTIILPSQNNWHYIVLSRNSNDKVDLYVDGKQPIRLFSDAVQSGTTYFSIIGMANDGSGQYYNGKIDHVKIYNYARTTAQIAYDYNKGAPIGWWKMDECQGNTAYDWSGNNNGTINIGSGGSQTSVGSCTDNLSTSAWNNGKTGKTNSSLNFDGIDDYLTTTSIPASESFSISTWFKPGSSVTDNQTIYWGNGTNRAVLAYSGILGNLKWYVQTTGGTLGYKISINKFKLNDWNHTVLIYNGSSVKLYINGILDPTTGSLIGTSSASGFNFGTNYNRTNNWFNGQIDDIRFYNYALTSEQIKTVYNGGAINFN